MSWTENKEVAVDAEVVEVVAGGKVRKVLYRVRNVGSGTKVDLKLGGMRVVVEMPQGAELDIDELIRGLYE